ncbi:hypothetical protein [Atlantibacter sp.]|uniref:hypothetical protein n=1 Tax=Atlantibacter sp. TaxID=1903473 RepID=UPI0028ADAEE4|nr:hypothetical protein [Atlantibacter sp.]
MSLSDIQLLSAIAGLLGSLLSAFSTFGYEPYPLAEFANDNEIVGIDRRNKRRKIGQTSGLILIAFSFLLQIVAVL